MFFLLIFKTAVWVKGKAGKVEARSKVLQIIVFFFIGIYGGFIQAGVGFFLISGLVLAAGLDLVRANAVKLLITLLYTPFALAIFMYNGDIDYKLGLILAVGNMLGAFVASRFAVSWGASFVRWFLLVVIFLASLKLLGVVDLFL